MLIRMAGWRPATHIATARTTYRHPLGHGRIEPHFTSAGYAARPMAALHILDIESAINWWRVRSPSPDGITACAEVRALAEVYALMVYFHETECDEDSMPPKARSAWLGWYAQMPDAPCIAICSTSQGDAECKGCGRTFEEVQHWTAYSPGQKRAVWRRITQENRAWRFNRYAERALRATGEDHPEPGTLEAPSAPCSGGEPADISPRDSAANAAVRGTA